MPELVVVLVVALIIFGPGKLPEIGKAVGRSIREFKQDASGLENTAKDIQRELEDTVKESQEEKKG